MDSIHKVIIYIQLYYKLPIKPTLDILENDKNEK